MPPPPTIKPFLQRRKLPSGYWHIHFNLHPGQQSALNSKKSITLVCAGVRSGKTVCGPLWLLRRMQAHGPGNYLIAAPTYPIIDKAAGPEVEKILGTVFGLGTMNRSPLEFRVSALGEQWLWPEGSPHHGQIDQPTRILFGHADEPESLEAMTVKDAWLDEAGQKRFKRDSFDTIRDRLAIDRGRMFVTSRPYSLGWMKQKIYDPWEKAGRNHPLIHVVNFDSRMNPVFPTEEYERAQSELPRSVFDMRYRGLFTRPAGLIFDCFDPATHSMPRFAIPEAWERFIGIDFGGVNTAAVFWACEPCDPPRYYAYREYWPRTGRTAKEHVAALLEGEPRIPTAVGGSWSEDQWRSEFSAAGLSVREPPVKDIEVGIQRAYGFINRGQVRVFSDLEFTLDELATYSRKLDDAGQATDAIDEKESYHLLDGGFRYLFSWLDRAPGRFYIGTG